MAEHTDDPTTFESTLKEHSQSVSQTVLKLGETVQRLGMMLDSMTAEQSEQSRRLDEIAKQIPHHEVTSNVTSTYESSESKVVSKIVTSLTDLLEEVRSLESTAEQTAASEKAAAAAHEQAQISASLAAAAVRAAAEAEAAAAKKASEASRAAAEQEQARLLAEKIAAEAVAAARLAEEAEARRLAEVEAIRAKERAAAKRLAQQEAQRLEQERATKLAEETARRKKEEDALRRAEAEAEEAERKHRAAHIAEEEAQRRLDEARAAAADEERRKKEEAEEERRRANEAKEALNWTEQEERRRKLAEAGLQAAREAELKREQERQEAEARRLEEEAEAKRRKNDAEVAARAAMEAAKREREEARAKAAEDARLSEEKERTRREEEARREMERIEKIAEENRRREESMIGKPFEIAKLYYSIYDAEGNRTDQDADSRAGTTEQLIDGSDATGKTFSGRNVRYMTNSDEERLEETFVSYGTHRIASIDIGDESSWVLEDVFVRTPFGCIDAVALYYEEGVGRITSSSSNKFIIKSADGEDEKATHILIDYHNDRPTKPRTMRVVVIEERDMTKEELAYYTIFADDERSAATRRHSVNFTTEPVVSMDKVVNPYNGVGMRRMSFPSGEPMPDSVICFFGNRLASRGPVEGGYYREYFVFSEPRGTLVGLESYEDKGTGSITTAAYSTFMILAADGAFKGATHCRFFYQQTGMKRRTLTITKQPQPVGVSLKQTNRFFYSLFTRFGRFVIPSWRYGNYGNMQTLSKNSYPPWELAIFPLSNSLGSMITGTSITLVEEPIPAYVRIQNSYGWRCFTISIKKSRTEDEPYESRLSMTCVFPSFVDLERVGIDNVLFWVNHGSGIFADVSHTNVKFSNLGLQTNTMTMQRGFVGKQSSHEYLERPIRPELSMSSKTAWFISDNFPPFGYTYVKSDGREVYDGLVVNRIRQIMQRLPQFRYRFATYASFADALKVGLNFPNVIIHSIVKNPEREKQYVFTDNPMQVDQSIFMKRREVRVLSNPIVGVLEGWWLTDELQSEGYMVKEYANINDVQAAWERDEFSLFATTQSTFANAWRAAGFDPRVYEIFKVIRKTPFYLAINRNSDRELIAGIKKGLLALGPVDMTKVIEHALDGTEDTSNILPNGTHTLPK